jgi:hypothetical protein
MIATAQYLKKNSKILIIKLSDLLFDQVPGFHIIFGRDSMNSGKEEMSEIEKQYNVLGKVGEGTYGVVRKASLKSQPGTDQAIKQFKTSASKEGEGISITACREVMVGKCSNFI